MLKGFLFPKHLHAPHQALKAIPRCDAFAQAERQNISLKATGESGVTESTKQHFLHTLTLQYMAGKGSHPDWAWETCKCCRNGSRWGLFGASQGGRELFGYRTMGLFFGFVSSRAVTYPLDKDSFSPALLGCWKKPPTLLSCCISGKTTTPGVPLLVLPAPHPCGGTSPRSAYG